MLAFHQSGSVYRVKRGFTSNGSPYLELERDGKPLRGTIPELEAIIEDVIGLDYDGFRNSTFVRQEEMKQLGAERPSERLEVFQKLFRLETFEKAADLAKAKLDTLRAEVQEAQGEMVVLKEQASQVDEVRKEVLSWKEQAGEYKDAFQEAKGKLTAREEQFNRLAKGHETYIKAKTALDGLRSSLEDLEARLREKREVLQALPGLREKSEALAREVKEFEDLEAEAQDLMERQQRATLLLKELESLETRAADLEAGYRSLVQGLERKVAEEEARLAGLSADMGIDEAFQILREEGSLEERIARIDKELDWLSERTELVSRLRGEQQEAREALAEIKGKVSSINRDTFLFTEIGERIEAIRNELEEKRAEREEKREELRQKQAAVKSKLEEAGYGPEEKKRLSTLREAQTGAKERRELLQRIREELQRLEGLEDMIREMEAQREDVKRKTEEANQLSLKLEKDEEAYRQAQRDVEQLRSQRDEVSKALFESEANLKAAERRLEELKQLKERQKGVEARLEELRGKAEVHTILREGVFHKKGVVMYAINRLLPELEIETSKNLNELTNGRLRRVKLETHEEARGYGIRILVEGVDGEWHDVGIFSGGERTQINAALRFAIARELASMPQVGRTYGRMKTLFIDEGDLGSLDTESSRELFVSKLFRMGDSFEKVVLITHLTEVAEKFPGRIGVTMTSEGESKAEVMA